VCQNKWYFIFSPAYRRTLETKVSVTDDRLYSTWYPSNCLVCQNIIVWYARTLLFGIPEHLSWMLREALTELTKIDRNRPKSTKIDQNRPKLTKIDQNRPKLTKIDQNRPKPTKINQNQPKSTKIDQNCPKLTKINQN